MAKRQRLGRRERAGRTRLTFASDLQPEPERAADGALGTASRPDGARTRQTPGDRPEARQRSRAGESEDRRR